MNGDIVLCTALKNAKYDVEQVVFDLGHTKIVDKHIKRCVLINAINALETTIDNLLYFEKRVK